MNMDRNVMTQRILDLTLEILYLLTREGITKEGTESPMGHQTQGMDSITKDHADVKVLLERVTDRSSHHVSGGQCTSQTISMEKKILELTDKITQLLTGEVPIRCEDVTVYLSMEEWEYVERHKELYEDIMMEDHQPVITADNSVSAEFHAPDSLPDFGSKNTCENIADNGGKCLNIIEATAGRAESASCTEQESPTCEETHVPEMDIYPTSGRAQTRYPSPDIKEEESNITDSAICKTRGRAQTEFAIRIKVESDSCDDGDTTDSDSYPTVDHRLTENPFAGIKKESQVYEDENLTDSNRDNLPESSEILYINNVGECVKGDINAVESREPDKGKYPETDMFPVIVSAEQPLSCTECEERFADSIALQMHQRIHMGEKLFNLSESEKSFPFQCELVRLQKIHADGKTFKCTECEEHFFLKNELYKHLKIHGIDKPFRCTVCGKGFALKSNLNKHAKIHTGEKPFKCEDCGKCFILARDLARHRMIHTGEKPYKCAECGKCFTQASSLASHKVTHTGEKPYKCAECEKCFTQASSLAVHKMSHREEKPFKCSECGKCYSRAADLATHKIIHTGKKPYNCNECGKFFTHSSALARHRRSHTGEKPYTCPECGKSFTRPSAVAAHKLIHTGEKPFICSECGKCFRLKDQITRHQCE